MSLKALSPSYYSRIQEASRRIPHNKKILDAGCSDGFFCFLNQSKGEVYGVDINPGDLRIAQTMNTTGHFSVAKLDSLPYPAEYFDIIVSIDVLEHLDDDIPAVKEFSRVIKKKGKLIIIVPQSNFPWTYDPLNYILKLFHRKLKIGMWGYGHQRLYTTDILHRLLSQHGFKIIEERYLSHHLLGIIDNCYINSLIQPLVKSDPHNLAETKLDQETLRKRITMQPPKFLTKIRDFLIKIDHQLFRNSKSSLEVLVVAEKDG